MIAAPGPVKGGDGMREAYDIVGAILLGLGMVVFPGWGLLVLTDWVRGLEEPAPRQMVKKEPPVTCGARHEGRTEKAA